MKRNIIIAAVLGLFFAQAQAATDNNANAVLKTQQDKVSYSIGLDVGANIKAGFQSQSITVNPAAFAKGVEDAMSGNKPLLTKEQVRETLTTFQSSMMEKAQVKARKIIAANHDQIANSKSSPVVGNPKGNTTLVEFFDYQCVHCRAMSPIIEKLTSEDPNLRIVYKEFPIFGADSDFAAKAALAAQKQGKYAAFHNALMAAPKKLSNDEVMAIAKQVKLNIAQLKKDMNSPDVANELKANQTLAKALNLVGTPAFVVTATQTKNGNIEKMSYLIPGTTSLQNLQKLVAEVQNAQQGPKAKFPANEQDPQEKPGTWQGI